MSASLIVLCSSSLPKSVIILKSSLLSISATLTGIFLGRALPKTIPDLSSISFNYLCLSRNAKANLFLKFFPLAFLQIQTNINIRNIRAKDAKTISRAKFKSSLQSRVDPQTKCFSIQQFEHFSFSTVHAFKLTASQLQILFINTIIQTWHSLQDS